MSFVLKLSVLKTKLSKKRFVIINTMSDNENELNTSDASVNENEPESNDEVSENEAESNDEGSENEAESNDEGSENEPESNDEGSENEDESNDEGSENESVEETVLCGRIGCYNTNINRTELVCTRYIRTEWSEVAFCSHSCLCLFIKTPGVSIKPKK
jgi:hypothetical protein